MKEETPDGVVECWIDGVAVTAELLSAYVRSWARHGVYFSTGENRPERLCDGVPASLSVLSSDALTYRFPHSHPDPMKRGRRNEHFLDPALLQNESGFLPASATGIVLLPMSHVYRTEGLNVEQLLCRLDRFLAALPAGRRYAFGVHNGEYLLPAYFDCLRTHAVAHVFTVDPALPGLLEQALLPYAFAAEASVVLTAPALEAEWQLGMMEIIRRSVDARKELYVHLQPFERHRLMPSLAVLMERMSKDLAKLSPIKEKAA